MESIKCGDVKDNAHNTAKPLAFGKGSNKSILTQKWTVPCIAMRTQMRKCGDMNNTVISMYHKMQGSSRSEWQGQIAN